MKNRGSKVIRQQGDDESRNWILITVILGLSLFLFLFLKLAKTEWASNRYYLMAVVGEEKISIIGVNKDEEKGYELIIPGNVMVPVVGMQGSLKANSLWQFGKDEGEPERTVEYSLERLLGVKINGVIKPRNNKVGVLDIWRSRGDGKLGDRLLWFRTWNDLRPDQKLSVGIEGNIGEQKRYPDGEEVVEVSEIGIKNWVKDFWTNTRMLDERIGVEVINASGVDGMGKLMESMIVSAGGLVLKVDMAEKREGRCFYAASETQLNSVTSEWIKNQLGCVRLKNEEVDTDIKIWIGEEWGERYQRLQS